MRNKKKKYKAVIVGAGRIAAGFDFPASKKILTHAHALKIHPVINLLGFFDVDKKTASRAAKKWGGRSFGSFEEAMANQPDITVVCVSTKHHYSVLSQIAKFKPKLVICEKPLTNNLADSERIIRVYKKAGIPILVNYFRRFDPAVQLVKKEISQGKYGKVICASGIYTKGVLNNGSHTLDLARFLFGEIKKAESTYQFNDYIKDDPSVAGFLSFERCPQFHLMVGDGRAYKIREFDILFEKGALIFIKDGMFLVRKKVQADKIYAGYKILVQDKIIETGYARAMLNLVENAVLHLRRGTPLLCDAADALKTQEACAALVKK